MFGVAEMKDAIKGKIQRDNNDDEDDGSVTQLRKGWSDLPQELVELLMSRVLYIDQINLRAACKSWHSTGRVPISPGSQNQYMPWLLCIKKKESWFSRSTPWSLSKLSDPTYKKTYTVNMSPLKKKIGSHKYLKVHESKSGWLLLSSSKLSTDRLHRLIMYSPFLMSNNLLELPALKAKKIILATFSLSYNNFCSYSDGWSYVVLSHVSRTSRLEISTIKWGDNTWVTQYIDSSNHLSPKGIKAWMYSQGLFYYAKSSGEVGSLSVDGEEWSTLPDLGISLSRRGVRMMRSDEEELYIFVVNDEAVRRQQVPKKISAFRLDLSSQPHASKSWENLASLGEDRTLFLDRVCKSSVKLISNTPKDVTNENSWWKYYGSVWNKTGYIKLCVEPPDHIYQ